MLGIVVNAYRWIEVFNFSSYTQTNNLSWQSRVRFLNKIKLCTDISMCSMFSMLTFYVAHCMNGEDFSKFKSGYTFGTSEIICCASVRLHSSFTVTKTYKSLYSQLSVYNCLSKKEVYTFVTVKTHK